MILTQSIMNKKLLILGFFFFSLKLFGQEILFTQNLDLKSGLNDKRESFPIVNDDKDEIVMLLFDSKNINCLLFNKKYGLIDNFTVDRPKNKFDVLLGQSSDSAGYHIFFTNDKKDQFYIETINFSEKKTTGRLLPLKLIGDYFLESISYNNKFYLFTIKNMSSNIAVYEFSGSDISNTRIFWYPSYEFSKSGNLNLYETLKDNKSLTKVSMDVSKIENSNPNPLDLTIKENKFYYYDNKAFLSIDNNLEYTSLITIDLIDFTSDVKSYKQVNVNCGSNLRAKSNSFLYRDNLFQIKVCPQELCFQITDINADSIFQEYRVNRQEDIKFRNTPLIQEGGTTVFTQDIKRELENTNQVLRKISASDIGISVWSSKDNLELTIGGYKEVQNSVGSVGPMMPSQGSSISTPYGTIRTSSPATNHYNPTMYGFNKYSNSRSVYFKTLLDINNYQHTEGRISENAYDKMRSYINRYGNEIVSETIFKVDDYYVLGYYRKYDNKYYLRKYKN